jgi:glycerol kinase
MSRPRDEERVEVVLSVDAGTTGVTVLMVTAEAEVVARGYAEFGQHFPQPGWVEHAPEEIWQATQTAARVALDGAPHAVIRAVGITNQRETAVLWDRHTLAAPRRAIVWQDRRTSAICERLETAGHGPRVTELTGLRLDPYFTGTKLAWLRENDPRTWAGVLSGQVVVGTVDSYLVARMTSGAAHLTDASNASRTLLYDVQHGGWSAELCELLGVPLAALPEVVPNWGEFARTDPAAFLGIDAPIAGMAGDQQAALFGQACFAVGEAKCTYGTGSFILVNTGSTLQRSDAGLLSTVAWQGPDGSLTYALEGAIFVTGAAVQWLRDGLQIIGSAAETAAIAGTVKDSAGVIFVPALTGLGAPHWDPQARGSIHGITRGTTAAHLVRATLEAIAFEVRDVFDTIETPIPVLRVDGGASENSLLMQMQADLLGVPVERPRIAQTTGMGAAFLAGLGAGLWSSQGEIAATWALENRFEPRPGGRAAADPEYKQWLKAVERSKGWEEPPVR